MLWTLAALFFAVFAALLGYRYYLEKAKKPYQNWTGRAAQGALALGILTAVLAVVLRRR